LIRELHKYYISDHDVLHGVCGQEEEKEFLAKLEKAEEEKTMLLSQLEKYQKAYPLFSDTTGKEAEAQVSQAGYWPRSKCLLLSL
jgi:hypothetical protein